MKAAAILDALGIGPKYMGGCAGPGLWMGNVEMELVSYNPTTAKPLGSVYRCFNKEYEAIVRAAKESFLHWRMVPAPKRGELVKDLGRALSDEKEPLGELVTLEMGKICYEGYGEVQEMIDMCNLAVGMSRQIGGPTLPSERAGHRMMEQWHPLGPVGVITAFNFPVAVWAWNAALACICGDTVIWKPSSLTPLCAIAVQNIANKVMADHGVTGVFTLCVSSGDIGTKMTDDERVPLVSFTGSTETGKRVAQHVAARFGRTILELGGNNAIIVAEDANVEMALRSSVFGAVGTAGQRCTSLRRIIVHKKVYQEFKKKLLDLYKRVSIGDPMRKDVLMGPLVNAAAVADMQRALEQAVEQGGVILTGGELLPSLGPNFVTPAIVEMPSQMPIVHKETFAPILYLMKYESLDTAIEMHNAVPQGLSSAIFTMNMQTMERFYAANGSDCGIANVNIGTSGAEIGGAFGGEKETGGGREAGSDSWKQYMRRQTNTVNWSNDLPLAQGIKFDLS